jgi:hypothetical protein
MPPVPVGRLLRIGREFVRGEIERIPDAHRGADIEREGQRVRDHLIAHRRNGLEVGADRQDVGARHLGVGRERHGGIKPRAVGANSPAHGVVEFVVGPRADAGVGIRSDVGRDDVAERGFDRAASGEWLAGIGNGVTGSAIGGDREIAGRSESVRTPGCRGCPPRRTSSQRAAPQARPSHPARLIWLVQASTSGPGFFRYWLRIAAADQ